MPHQCAANCRGRVETILGGRNPKRACLICCIEYPRFALSVQQPYADLIVTSLKDVENRTWPAPEKYIGERILIHAGKRPAKNADRQYWALFDEVVEDALKPDRLGGFVGAVTLVECAREYDSEWFEGPYGFVLEDADYYTNIIPYSGQLGFFEVS